MPVVLLFSEHSSFAASELIAWGQSLLGGVLIGGSAAALLGTLGRVAGISGILGGLLPLPKVNTSFEVGWRTAFLMGLLSVGILVHAFGAHSLTNTAPRSMAVLLLAGLLVGFGTRLGSGCTSGHGVCGISRGSIRSVVATLTFIATGALTVAVVRAIQESS